MNRTQLKALLTFVTKACLSRYTHVHACGMHAPVAAGRALSGAGEQRPVEAGSCSCLSLKGIYLEILVASGEGSRGAGDEALRDTYLLLFPFCSF